MSDTIDTDTAGWEADSPADAPAAPSPAQMPQHRPQAAQGDGGGQDDEPDRLADDAEVDMQFVRKLRSEAKGLRTRAQIAEDERDGLRTVVDGLRKAEVERLAATELRDARDLLDRHPNVAEFIDEHGHVDAERVIGAREIAADRPHYARDQVLTAPPTDRPVEGLRSGASPDRKIESPGWAGAIRPIIGGV